MDQIIEGVCILFSMVYLAIAIPLFIKWNSIK